MRPSGITTGKEDERSVEVSDATRRRGPGARTVQHLTPVPAHPVPPRPNDLRSPQRQLALVRASVDFLTVGVAVALTLLWAEAADIEMSTTVTLCAFPFVALGVMYLRGLYNPRLRLTVLDEIPTVIGTLSIAAMLVIALGLATNIGTSPSPLAVRAWLLAAVLVPCGRAFVASSQRRRRLRHGPGRPALIVGAGAVGTQVVRRLLSHPEYGLRPVGFLDIDPPEHADRAARLAPLLGSPEDLQAIAEHTGATTVIVAFSSESDHHRVRLVRTCQQLGLDVLVVPRLFDTFNQRACLEHLGGLPLLSLRRADPRGWEFAVKHMLDRIGAAILLGVLSPLMLLVAIGVKITSPGPLLFRQRRVGRDCQPFDLLKFRSMSPVGDGGHTFRPRPGKAPGGVEGSDRRTGFGRFIRRTALDELPQLINVLRGEMSLVGPRPERPQFVEMFEGEVLRYGERHRVKAGITGWAQVNGLRGQTSIADRAELDNFYIENWSLGLDLVILALTLRALLARQEE